MFFWTEILNAIPEICRSHLPSLGVIPLSAPVIMGTTVVFNFHIFSSSSPSHWYFLSSFFLMLLSLGIATAFFLCYVRHHYVRLVRHCLFVLLYMKVPQDLSSVIPNHPGGGGVSHFDLGTSRQYSQHRCSCMLCHPLDYGVP